MITLRRYDENDIPLLVEYLNNPRVTAHLTSRIPQPYTINDAQWWVREGSTQGYTRAIEWENRLVGTIGANRGQFEFSRSAEIGYWLAEPFWGNGIATAALSAVTTEIFRDTDIVRLFANVVEGNTASCRVLEKCGYQQEALLQKAFFKHDIFNNAHLYVKLAPR